MNEGPSRSVKRRWRDYQTTSGRRPVKEFINALTDDEAGEIAAAMRDVVMVGLAATRHLRGDIYEIRADARNRTFRILFASEGSKGRVLLALEGFAKKTQKTPDHLVALAEHRLADWRSRGRARRYR